MKTLKEKININKEQIMSQLENFISSLEEVGMDVGCIMPAGIGIVETGAEETINEIEEYFGCPAEAYIEALKNWHVWVEIDNEDEVSFKRVAISGIDFLDSSDIWFLDEYNDRVARVSEYKVSWWLAKDKTR